MGKLLLVGLAGGLIALLAQPVPTTNTTNQASLIGSWEITATTDSALSADISTPALATFTPEGSVIEADALELAPSRSTPGHGIWQLSPAVPNFFVRVTNIVARPITSQYAKRILTMTIGLNSTGDEFSGAYSFEVVEPSGQVLASGTGTVLGRRMIHPLLP